MVSNADEARERAEYVGGFKKEFLEAEKLAHEDSLKWSGGAASLRNGAKSVQALMRHAKGDLKDGRLTDEAFEAVRLYLNRATEVCNSLALQAEVKQQRARGRAEAMGLSAKMMSDEVGENLKVADQFDNPPRGVHPLDRKKDRPHTRERSLAESPTPDGPQGAEAEDSAPEAPEGHTEAPTAPVSEETCGTAKD